MNQEDVVDMIHSTRCVRNEMKKLIGLTLRGFGEVMRKRNRRGKRGMLGRRRRRRERGKVVLVVGGEVRRHDVQFVELMQEIVEFKREWRGKQTEMTSQEIPANECMVSSMTQGPRVVLSFSSLYLFPF